MPCALPDMASAAPSGRISATAHRQRQFDTRAGSLDLALPKLRHGYYFPDWLLERRKRAERALTTVVATCYLLGVSTRRMDKLVEILGITSLSKSQVSVMAKEVDAAEEAFRTRPLDADPYTFMAADALVRTVREAGQVVNVHALITTGVKTSCIQVRRVTRQIPRRRSFAALVQGPASSGRSMTERQAMFDANPH